MAYFPGSVYPPRTKTNKVGVIYNSLISTTLFAEDLVNLDNEVVSIENYLFAGIFGDVILKNISVSKPSFTMTAAPLVHAGTNYDLGSLTSVILNDKATVDLITTTTPVIVPSADGIEDWGVALVTVAGSQYATIYFKNSDFTDGTDFSTWLAGIISQTVVTDYFHKSIWVAGTPTTDYIWTNPDVKVVVTGCTTPPTFNYTPTSVFVVDYSTGITSIDKLEVGGASYDNATPTPIISFDVNNRKLYDNTGAPNPQLDYSDYGSLSGAGAYSPYIGANSLFLGYHAGYLATNAGQSFFFGMEAGSEATNAYNACFFGSNAGYQASEAGYSNFFGSNAGYQAIQAGESNFFGSYAGYQASWAARSNFFGTQAGYQATSAYDSNFMGSYAGSYAINAYWSNFYGNSAGYGAISASNSNFFGLSAGNRATNADNSNFFGNSAGSGATHARMSNFFGSSAGYGAIYANNSMFMGNNAGMWATYAQFSNFFGDAAGDSAVQALDSNFFGYRAGYFATNAHESNFYGFRAGSEAQGASESIFIGTDAGYQDTVDNTAGFRITGYNTTPTVGGTGYAFNDILTITGGNPLARVHVNGVDGLIGEIATTSAGSSQGTLYNSGDLIYISGSIDQAQIYVDTVGAGGEVATWHWQAHGSGYSIGTNVATTTLGSGTGFVINIDSVYLGIATSVTMLQGEDGLNYTTGVGNATTPVTGTGIGCTVEITSVSPAGTPNGTSIAIGKKSGTGGFSNSIAIGHGVINSATEEMNLGNAIKIIGIHNSDTPSSTLLTTSKVNIANLNISTLPSGTTVPGGLSAGDIWVDTTGGLNMLKII